jgi:hypothetical protein
LLVEVVRGSATKQIVFMTLNDIPDAVYLDRPERVGTFRRFAPG